MFDLTDARPRPAAGRRSTREDAAEIAEARRDLRQLARDIAAGDVSPSVLRRAAWPAQRTKSETTPTRTEPH